MRFSDGLGYAGWPVMTLPATEGVLLVAHGTITELDDLVPFLTAIRRGRPPSESLVEEIRRRYEQIGGSPLLTTTRQQADALATLVHQPVFVGMRFGRPSIEQALGDAWEQGVRGLTVLPMAPYSVQLYSDEVSVRQRAMQGQPGEGIRLTRVAAWGSHPGLVNAHVENIRERAGDLLLRGASLVLSAHSLPMRVIEAGDSYAREVESSKEAIARAIGLDVELGYQSQGADGGRWLGPDLKDVVSSLANRGKRHIVVAPFGFLCDHVETLYDLDVELRRHTDALGVTFDRVPALGVHPGLMTTLGELVGSA